MSEPETKNKNTSSLIMPDWSRLPEELLHLISKNLEDEDYCFDVVHARSVCSSWRSAFPFPSSIIRASYSLPKFDKFPLESEGLCAVEKVPFFLFRFRAPSTDAAAELLIGGISGDDHMQLPSPIQCSVKIKIPGSAPSLMNTIDCQILPLGHQYRIIGCNPRDYRGVAFLPLNKEGGEGGFIVLLNCSQFLLVLTSAEMKWKRLDNIPEESFCGSLVTFRGRFYATFLSRQIAVIDPYSLEVTLLLHSPQKSVKYLVPSGNDELFLVELTIPRPVGGLHIDQLTLRVSRLQEKASTWVEISDLGDRVLFINELGHFSCSAKELPHDCGVSGNSICITHGLGKLTFAYKYGVHMGNADDDLNCWRYSRENRVMRLHTSFPFIALMVGRWTMKSWFGIGFLLFCFLLDQYKNFSCDFIYGLCDI